MPATANCALIRRWFEEVWNQGRMETISELMDENGTGFGQAGHESELHGPAAFTAFARRFRGAFPDIKLTVEEVFGDDDRVAVRWSADMTHTGGDLGIPPTNRKAHVTGMTMIHMKDGKLFSGWDNWDQLALLRQLGVVPEQAEVAPALQESDAGHKTATA
jgi:steroid delta-isomerase-like uncharacterized protein